jgi:hypothetical protein
MTSIDFITVARRIVLAMACGVALLSVVLFITLLVVERDSLLEAVVQSAPLAAVALLGVYGATMARCLAPR